MNEAPDDAYPVPVETLADDVYRLADNALSSNTKRAYDSDWRRFTNWCARYDFPSLPASADAVCMFIADLSKTLKIGTIERRLTAIAKAHERSGYVPPTTDARVRATIAGARRTLGRSRTQKAPALVNDLRRMSEALPDSLIGRRDRAILMIGFAGALRQSELVGLDVSDVERCEEGLRVTIRQSKTDQEGVGRVIGVPFGSNLLTCPVRAFTTWLDASGIADGPLLRPINRHGQMADSRLGSQAVAAAVKRAAERIGLDPSNYAGHSLRIGLVTAAVRAGVAEHDIQRQTGHKNVEMLRRYVAEGTVFERNPAAAVGL